MPRLRLTVGATVAALGLVASSCSDSTGSTGTAGPTATEMDASTTVACPNPPAPLDQLADAQLHITGTLIADFQSGRQDDGYRANRCWHDWSSDDCSAPGVGSTGVSFDFTHPCHRHDFGYRNHKRLDDEIADSVWNEVNKRIVDDQFLADTRNHCSGRVWYLKAQCFAWSQTFYLAVRAFGV